MYLDVEDSDTETAFLQLLVFTICFPEPVPRNFIEHGIVPCISLFRCGKLIILLAHPNISITVRSLLWNHPPRSLNWCMVPQWGAWVPSTHKLLPFSLYLAYNQPSPQSATIDDNIPIPFLPLPPIWSYLNPATGRSYWKRLDGGWSTISSPLPFLNGCEVLTHSGLLSLEHIPISQIRGGNCGIQISHWRLSLLKNGLWLRVALKLHYHISGMNFVDMLLFSILHLWLPLAEYVSFSSHMSIVQPVVWFMKCMDLQCSHSELWSVGLIIMCSQYPMHTSSMWSVYTLSGMGSMLK